MLLLIGYQQKASEVLGFYKDARWNPKLQRSLQEGRLHELERERDSLREEVQELEEALEGMREHMERLEDAVSRSAWMASDPSWRSSKVRALRPC